MSRTAGARAARRLLITLAAALAPLTLGGARAAPPVTHVFMLHVDARGVPGYSGDELADYEERAGEDLSRLVSKRMRDAGVTDIAVRGTLEVSVSQACAALPSCDLVVLRQGRTGGAGALARVDLRITRPGADAGATPCRAQTLPPFCPEDLTDPHDWDVCRNDRTRVTDLQRRLLDHRRTYHPTPQTILAC